MDFANRGNRPAQQPAPQKDSMGAQTPQFRAPSSMGSGSMDIGKASSIFVLIGTSLLVLALIFALVFGKGDNKANDNKEGALINANQYQAVFLSSQDGQVYFGKLAIYNSELYVLSDIYYVRVENPIQPSDGNATQQANISLAKLGNELHAPEDVMYISRDQVLYWENLKDDGQVVSAITEYKANGGNTNQQNTNTNNNTQPTNSNPANNETDTTDSTNP